MKKLSICWIVMILISTCLAEDMPIIEWSERTTYEEKELTQEDLALLNGIGESEFHVIETTDFMGYGEVIDGFALNVPKVSLPVQLESVSWTELSADVIENSDITNYYPQMLNGETFYAVNNSASTTVIEIWLPDDVMLAGEQRLFLICGDKRIEVNLQLTYMHGYQYGKGWEIKYKGKTITDRNENASAIVEREPKPVSQSDKKEGDILIFGHYEQDGDLSNGEEDLEWYVVDIGNTEYTLICKNVIDSMPFSISNLENSSWENCDLRKWLNSDFLTVSFSEEESRRIVATTVVTKCFDNGVDVKEEYETTDKVYLPSDEEWVEKYSGIDIFEDWWFNPSYSPDVTRISGWWERDTYYYGSVIPGEETISAGVVYKAGYTSVDMVDCAYGIRPVMRIRR